MQDLVLLYINDRTENLNSNSKLFKGDTSLFSTVNSVTQCNSQIRTDLANINDWANKWKLAFNPDHIVPTHEVVFSPKIIKLITLCLL